jgi:cytochrome c oxidase cbb3-type subunit 3
MGFRIALIGVLLAGACKPLPPKAERYVPPVISYPQHVNVAGIPPAAGTLNNPYGTDSGSVREGGQTFTTMNCDGCHGGGATGWVGPSLVDGRWRYGGEDGAVFTSIFYGRPRGMPAYGGTLSPTAIWKIVSYIRAQPVPSDVPTERW